MKARLFAAIFAFVLAAANAQNVSFPDPHLQSAVRNALSLPQGPVSVSQILALTNLTATDPDIRNTIGLETATNLLYLDLNTTSVTNFSGFSGLAKLTELHFDSAGLSNLGFMSGLTNLVVLSLNFDQVQDVSPLAGLRQLQHLELDWNPVTNHTSLASLTNLISLHLYGNSLAKADFLSGYKQLQELSLYQGRLQDASPLTSLSNLVVLDLTDTGVTNASALAGLTGLTELDLGGNSITNIAFLASLTSLQTLRLGFNQISDFSPLLTLGLLQSLDLSENGISDAAVVSDLVNLTGLTLSYNSLSDLAPLSDLTQLQSLSLDHNQLASVAPLAGLTNLAYLQLDYNFVSDISPLLAAAQLQSIGLVNNLLSTNSGSAARSVVAALQARGASVNFLPQGPPPTLSLSLQPQSQIAAQGAAVSFSVTASGWDPMFYQWRFNDTNVAGASNARLAIASAQPVNAGNYRVVVTNAQGAVTSAVASLTISPGPPVGTSVQGSGIVTVSPNTNVYALGQLVTLTASPARYNGFVRWSDGSTNNPRLVNIALTNSYTAVFTNLVPLETYVVDGTNLVVPAGTPLVLVNGHYATNWSFAATGAVSVTVTSSFANPSIFYTLDGNEPDAGSAYYTGPLVVSNSITLRALAYDETFENFQESDPVVITFIPVYAVSAATAGGGSVSVSPATGPYLSNSIVTFTASSSNGWVFMNWGGDAAGSNPVFSVTLNGSESVQAVFGTPLNNSISPSTNYGSVLRQPEQRLYPFGTSVRLSAVPQATNYFIRWIGGPSGLSNSPINFTVTVPNTNAGVLFAALPTNNFALTALVNGDGSVSKTPQLAKYTNSQTVTLNATPAPNRIFLGWSGDATGGQNPLTLLMDANQTITANFTTNTTTDPFIVTPPQSAALAPGTNSSLNVTALGTQPLTYQWRFNGTNVAGATDAAFPVTNLRGDDTGLYTVVVANSAGSVTSAPAELTLYLPLIVTTIAGQASVGSADGTNSSARFNLPGAVTTDADGNVYVADTSNFTIRKITPQGAVTTLAGNVGVSETPDDAGTNSLFDAPSALAMDSAKNIYVADRGTYTIRKISPSGLVSTIAGRAYQPGTNDGTNGDARFYIPVGIVLAPSGYLYVSDSGNHTIRKISPTGVVTTFAGQAGNAGYVDGIGRNALFNRPEGMAADATGNLYVADNQNLRIRKITLAGIVTTVAGSGDYGYVDAAGTNAQFADPAGVALDSRGNIYVVESRGTVRTITPTGEVSTFAGVSGMNGSIDGSAANALFNQPLGIAVDSSNNVYVADTYNNSIRKISNGLVTTLAGVSGSRGDGQGLAARFWQPAGVAVDGHGKLYVADTGNATIRTITPSGLVTTLAGQTGRADFADGFGTNALFNSPWGIALDSAGDLFVTDNNTHKIRKLTSAGLVTTLAGSAGGSYGTNDGPGPNAQFAYPQGIAIDAAGTLYVADTENDTIRKISTNDYVTTLAGRAGVSGSTDGPASTACFSEPAAIAVDDDGNLFVTDRSNDTIRKVTPDGIVSTVAGLAGSGDNLDGAGRAARFYIPEGIAIDSAHNLYVAQYGYNTIRKITPSGVVTTIAGRAGTYGATDGVGANALFYNPKGITVDAGGNLYIADSGNNTIRKGGFAPYIAASPQDQIAALGTNTTLVFRADGSKPFSYQWRRNGVNLSGATNAALQLVNLQPPDGGGYDVVLSSDYGAATSSVAILTLLAPPAITTQPQNNIAANGGNVGFSVTATGGGLLAYQWQFNGTNIPGATSTGVLLTSVTPAQAGLYRVIITNIVGALASAPATLGVITNGTAVAGTIADSTWTAANSPYVLGMNAIAGNLTIQPGVSVLFNGPYNLTVTGLLQAVGTSNNPITFTGGSPGVAWQGIRLVSANANSLMTWCVVRGASATALALSNTPMALNHCLIDSNSGVDGAGIYTDSSLLLQNCSVINNAASYVQRGDSYFVRGGGLFIAGGNAILQSCVLSNNSAVMPFIGNVTEISTGGGIHCQAGNLSLSNCVVVSNLVVGAGGSAVGAGGAVYMDNPASSFTATLCTFSGNAAERGFGGALATSAGTLLNCIFSRNQAGHGGALFLNGNSQLMATNCLISANSASFGGAVYSVGADHAGVFENCTVVANSSDAFNGFSGFIHNSILFFDGNEIIPGAAFSPVISYSDVQGGYAGPGTNNLNVDPQFADTTNYLLSPASPLIDAGDPLPRFQDQAFPPAQGTSLNDLGAYGGPRAGSWPAFAGNVPVVLVNGQPAQPLEVFTFPVTEPPVITFTNGFAGGSFEYTLDGSNPLENPTLTASPLVLTQTAVIRVIAYPPDYSSVAIAPQVTINVLPAQALTAGAAGGGGVFPSGGSYLINSVVTLTATNAPGWTFLGWKGDAAGTNNPISVLMNGPKNVQAIFGAPLHTSVTGSGTIFTNPVLALYPYGSTVQLSGIPANTNTYLRLWGAAGGNNTNSPLNLVFTTAGTSVNAVFAALPANNRTLNLIVNGQGTVTRTPQASFYTNGSLVLVAASPAPGYLFTGWTGDAIGTNNPLPVMLNSSKTITATFGSTLPPPILPPLVSLTNPIAGAIFTAPASITLNASASDPNSNGAIAQVAYFAGTNQLAVLTNPPFTFVWTNAAPGTNVISALATDNFGLSSLSTPVSVTVSLPAPGPAVFSLSSSAYSILGNGGSVTVTILKSLNSLAGTVNYTTQDGSAVAASGGVGNYTPVSGSLSFTNGQLSQTVSIPIVNNLVYVGNRSFSFLLSASGDGSSLQSPSGANVTIIDVNSPATTNSFLQTVFPGAVPQHDGQLIVDLEPDYAGGQWRLVWETAWRNSRALISGLPSGNYPVEFKPVAGFLQPPISTNPVTAGALTLTTNLYAVSGTPQFGSLTVTLQPTAVATALPLSARGQWHVQGDTNWYDSGFTYTNLIAGDQIVEFKSIAGWVTPASRVVLVGADQINAIASTYLVAPASGSTPPTVLQFSDASTPGFGLPYVYNGQLLSDVGYGSGCVVKRRVVLTAAHVVFNDATLSYVSGVQWFFQRYAGTFEPPAQTARGWYLFSGYASARASDNSPGVSSPLSQNLDTAALYFLADAGRGGSSGYLVSDPAGTEWLQATALKSLVGYPVEVVSDINRGKLHATTPGNLSFTLVTNQVFSTPAISGYPGMSGGPLCIQYTNGTYYPAAVFLGGSDQTIVRAIDGAVADLINRADVTANTGDNNTGGGVITISPGQTGSGLLAYVQVQLGPPAALAAGGGWRVQGTTDYSSSPTYTAGIAKGGSVTLEFKPIAGWNVPTNQSVIVALGQTTIIPAFYTPATTSPPPPPLLVLTRPLGLGITGVTGATFRLEFRTSLKTGSWLPLKTNTLGPGTNLLLTFPFTNRPAAYYRAVWLP